MGIGYTVHVGPYVKCNYEMVEVEAPYMGCPDLNHKGFVEKFCSKCGKAAILLTKKDMKPSVRISELEEMLYDLKINYDNMHSHSFYDENSVYYFSNTRKTPRPFSFDPRSDDFTLDFIDNKVDIQAEIDWLIQNYSKYIEILKKLYGEDKVEISWGVVSYGS